MKTTTTTIVVLIIAGCTFAMIEEQGDSRGHGRPKLDPNAAVQFTRPDTNVAIHASGRIEGRTEQIEIRARLIEQIRRILVHDGQWVSQGEVLIELESDERSHQRQLASAQLDLAIAKMRRVENGYRDTEIQAARKDYEAMRAQLDGAQKNLDRIQRLAAQNAASPKTVDDQITVVDSLTGEVAAAKSRLGTFEAPPREDDLHAANAEVAAAEARLAIADINLARTKIVAPVDCRVLSIDGEVGELVGPNQESALVTLADTRQLQVMAEIDEYDALRLELGQHAFITADSADGVLAQGTIASIEPLMNRKQLFGDRAGTRSDAFARRVWIELADVENLPVGLPVEVYIRKD